VGNCFSGLAPIHVAVMKNNMDIVRFLLAEKADINIQVRIIIVTLAQASMYLQIYVAVKLKGRDNLCYQISFLTDEKVEILMGNNPL
jgi:ankyrin repeat protein